MKKESKNEVSIEELKTILKKGNSINTDFSNVSISLEELIETFNTLTSRYRNVLLHLQAQTIFINSHEFNDVKVKEFKNKIMEQINKINHSPFNEKAKEEYLLNALEDLKLTPKEQEIILLIYRKVTYSSIYKEHLHITKRTFDDHLNRIAQKLYNAIQNQKERYLSFIDCFPNYPQKENIDGSFTFSQPFHVLKHYLSFF